MGLKFGGYIYRANPNKSTLKNLEKRERGRIQGLRNFGGYPILSQEWVKLRTSNFVGTFIGSIGTKAHENVWNSSRERSLGVPKIFLAPMCRAHCAVIFAIAQLSYYIACRYIEHIMQVSTILYSPAGNQFLISWPRY